MKSTVLSWQKLRTGHREVALSIFLQNGVLTKFKQAAQRQIRSCSKPGFAGTSLEGSDFGDKRIGDCSSSQQCELERSSLQH